MVKKKNSYISCENLYEKFVNSSYDAITITDKEGRFLVANKATADSMGLLESDILGKRPDELIGKGIYSNSTILEAMKEKKTVTGLVNVRGVHRLSTSVPCFDDCGNLEFVMTNNRSDSIMNEFVRQLAYEQEQHAHYKNLTDYLYTFNEEQMVCTSEKMHAIRRECAAIALSDSSVMLIGESGVGKEMVAKFIHSKSPRNAHAFIPVNCSAIPPELFESEFFGYRPGAFTGANAKGKAGLLQMAHMGTLFLDELGELPLLMQSKLLRFVESGEFYPIGSNKPEKVDVRIITATNRNLLAMINEKTFRDDLYYRLHVLPIRIPPLRERPEDILSIATYYVNRYNQKYSKEIGISEESKKVLLKYAWPGNVRELRNVIERAVLISPPGTRSLSLESILYQEWESSAEVPSRSASPEEIFALPSLDLPLNQAVELFEQHYIDAVIQKNGGQLAKAAKSLGIHRTTLYRKQGKPLISQDAP